MSRLPDVRVAAIVYEADAGGNETESALRVSRVTGARVFRAASDQDVRLALKEAGPIDLGIIANFGIILSESALRLAKSGMINFHPGLLPDQAGREPIARLWNQGGGSSGLTIHTVTAQIDAGPVLFMEPGRVDPDQSLNANILALYRLGLPRLPQVIFSAPNPSI